MPPKDTLRMPALTDGSGCVGGASSPSPAGCKFGGKAVRLLGDGRVAAGLNRVGGVVLMVCIINSKGWAGKRPRELSFARPNARCECTGKLPSTGRQIIRGQWGLVHRGWSCGIAMIWTVTP